MTGTVHVGAAPERRVVVLGSTGSIGRQALEIIAVVPGLRAVGLAADSNAGEIVDQARAAGVGSIALRDETAAVRARETVNQRGAGEGDPAVAAPQVLGGEAGVIDLIEQTAAAARADGVPLTVLNGIVGAAGLRATMATLRTGATLALANKESLVAGGDFVLAAARRSGAAVLPVDSEHSAVFQCLLAGRPARPGSGAGEGADAAPGAPGLGGRLLPAEQIVLTGSGGPFRGRTRAQLADVTPDQALRHPTWTMGRKITIDSASLMNKGLEVIEAHYLFGVPYESIDVLVSPQSLVHAMVRFADGATIAHLGVPDMRAPIAYALTYPERPPLPTARRLDLTAHPLTFEPPDSATFGCLRLAYEAGAAGGGAPIVLNAANEVAVHAFLDGRLSFLGIEAAVEDALGRLGTSAVRSLDDVFALDDETRRLVSAAL
jgi:1-deoxy-D-xylulose-5-phosphate reductoisomerase